MSCVDPVWINVSPQWGNYLKFVFYTAVALYRRKGLFEIVNDCGSLPFRISPSSWLCAFLLVQIPSATLVESPFLFNWHSPGSTSWRCLGLCPVSQPWWSLMIKIGLTASCLKHSFNSEQQYWYDSPMQSSYWVNIWIKVFVGGLDEGSSSLFKMIFSL